MKPRLFFSLRTLLALIVLLPMLQPAVAQPGGGVGFEIRRNATPVAYYVHVLFRGAEAADIATVPERSGILISYSAAKEQKEQSDRGVRFFSSSQSLNSRIGIPPDGDLSRMQRIDKPGWIQLIVPRRR